MNFRNLVATFSNCVGMLKGLHASDFLESARFLMPPEIAGPELELIFKFGGLRQEVHLPFSKLCLQFDRVIGSVRHIEYFWFFKKSEDSFTLIAKTFFGLTRLDQIDGALQPLQRWDMSEHGKDADDEAINIYFLCVLNILADCANDPSNHVVRVVDPKTDSKKVKWRISREHYLIVNRQEATSAIQKSKGNVTQEQLMRGVGKRRAHPRFYRHPKWGEKIGKLMAWVKEAWCGPIEWKGLDNKIYTWVDPKTLNH